ncbi:MAG: iron ABC transporter permease [Pseudomonadota bacterium]
MRLSWSYLFATPIALAAVAPLFILFVLADDYASVFALRNLELLLNTLALAVLSASGAVLIGVPLAFFLAFVSVPLPRFWLALFAAPLAVPSYLGAFTFYAAFGSGGELDSWLGVATPSVTGLWGAALVISLYTYPFVMLTVRAALLNQDANVIEAARTLGLSLRASLFVIVLPRVLPSIAAGALLSALYAISDFGTPAIMNFDTFTRLIYVEYNSYGLAQAALFSLQLLVLVSLVLFLEGRLRVTRENPGRALHVALSKFELTLAVLLFLPILLLAVGVPLSVFFHWFLREGVTSFDPSLAWNSAVASALAALVAMVAAIPVALAARRGSFGRFLERVSFFGFGIPGIVMGTVLVYLGLQLPLLYQTLALLVLAYVMRFFSLAVGSARSSFEKLDGGLTDAALLLGASKLEAFWRVTLPLSVRGVLAGAALVFLEAMRELPATLMLAPTGFETLATYLWRVYEAGYFGRAAVPSLLLVVLSTCGLLVVLLGEKHPDEGGRVR